MYTLFFKGTPQVQAVVGSVTPTANPTSSPTKAGEKEDNSDKSDVSGPIVPLAYFLTSESKVSYLPNAEYF